MWLSLALESVHSNFDIMAISILREVVTVLRCHFLETQMILNQHYFDMMSNTAIKSLKS